MLLGTGTAGTRVEQGMQAPTLAPSSWVWTGLGRHRPGGQPGIENTTMTKASKSAKELDGEDVGERSQTRAGPGFLDVQK